MIPQRDFSNKGGDGLKPDDVDYSIENHVLSIRLEPKMPNIREVQRRILEYFEYGVSSDLTVLTEFVGCSRAVLRYELMQLKDRGLIFQDSQDHHFGLTDLGVTDLQYRRMYI